MAEEKMNVDDAEEIKGVKLSSKEKKTLRRQQKKLKKFGVVDENELKGLEKFIYVQKKKRRIKKKKRGTEK